LFGHIGGGKQIEPKQEKTKHKEPPTPQKAPKPYTPPAKQTPQKETKTPKQPKSPNPAPKPQHSQSHATPVQKQSKGGFLDSIKTSKDSKGDVIVSVNSGRSKSNLKGSTKSAKETHTVVGSDGKKHKQTTVTTTITTFRCGGCGATQTKNSHQCSSCGAKLKK